MNKKNVLFTSILCLSSSGATDHLPTDFNASQYFSNHFITKEILRNDLLNHSQQILGRSVTAQDLSTNWKRLKADYLKKHYMNYGRLNGFSYKSLADAYYAQKIIENAALKKNFNADDYFDSYFLTADLKKEMYDNALLFNLTIPAGILDNPGHFEELKKKYLTKHYLGFGINNGLQEIIKDCAYKNALQSNKLRIDFNPHRYFEGPFQSNYTILDADIRENAQNFGLPNTLDSMTDLQKNALRSAYLKRHARVFSPSSWMTPAEHFAHHIQNWNQHILPELAQAWANITADHETFFETVAARTRLTPFHIPEENLNETIRPAFNERDLYRHPVPGDGDCGYWTFGITRAEAIQRLQAQILSPNNLLYKDFIFHLIWDAIVEGNLPDQFKALSPEYALCVFNSYESLRTISSNDDFAQELRDIFIRTINSNNLLTRNWIYENNTMISYIQHEIESGRWLHFVEDGPMHRLASRSFIDLLGMINNENIVIYEAVENSNDLRVLHRSYYFDANKSTRHILFSGNHYDLLTVNYQPIRTQPEGQRSLVTYDRLLNASKRVEANRLIQLLDGSFSYIHVSDNGIHVRFTQDSVDSVCIHQFVRGPEEDVQRIGRREDTENVMDRARHAFVQQSAQILINRNPNLTEWSINENINALLTRLFALNNSQERARFSRVRGGKNVNEVDNAIRTIHGVSRSHDHLNVLDPREVAGYFEGNKRLSMKELLAIVYQEILNWPNQQEQNLLFDSLVTRLGECIEDDGHRTCSVGKNNRLCAVLQGYVPGVQIELQFQITPQNFFESAAQNFEARIQRDENSVLYNQLMADFPDDWDHTQDVPQINAYRNEMLALARNAFRANGNDLNEAVRLINAYFDQYIEDNREYQS